MFTCLTDQACDVYRHEITWLPSSTLSFLSSFHHVHHSDDTTIPFVNCCYYNNIAVAIIESTFQDGVLDGEE